MPFMVFRTDPSGRKSAKSVARFRTAFIGAKKSKKQIQKVIMMKNDNTTSNQKVAIVTGASGGIGLGMAKTLLERGYRVVANSRNITKSKTLASSENLLLVDGDIGTKEIAVKVVDAAVQKFGRVDLL